MKILVMLIVLLLFCTTTFAETSPQNTFLSFRLGMSEEDFLSKNSDAVANTFGLWIFFTKIKSDGMEFYSLSNSRKTESGTEVKINAGFHQGKLAIIDVEYVGLVAASDLIDALTTKYGKPTDHTTDILNDPIAGESRRIEHWYWENSTDVVVDLYYMPRLLLKRVILADKSTQEKVTELKRQKNKGLLE